MCADELSPDILIGDLEPEEWGEFNYRKKPSGRPRDEQMWYNVLAEQTDDVVHWWKQICLNKDCLIPELQRISNQECSSSAYTDSAEYSPLVNFKESHPKLYEFLNTAFGMIMSNSHLCEQIHGMIRARLRKDIGMEQADHMLSHLTGLSYELREERHQSEADRLSTKRQKSRDYSKNSWQVLMQHGDQLAIKLSQWLPLDSGTSSDCPRTDPFNTNNSAPW
jgi:hypothetical protein